MATGIAKPMDDELVEVRFYVRRGVFNVFDAVSKAVNKPKNKLGATIFEDWADRERHRASMVMRLTRSGNGNDPQTDWGDMPE